MAELTSGNSFASSSRLSSTANLTFDVNPVDYQYYLTTCLPRFTTALWAVDFRFGVFTDLSIYKTTTPSIVLPGTTSMIYNLAVANVSDEPATGIVIADVLPPQVTYQTVTSPVGTNCAYLPAVRTVSCTTSNLAAGGTLTITIAVTIPPGEAVITNTATVATLSEENNLDNNSSTRVTVISDLQLYLPLVAKFGDHP